MTGSRVEILRAAAGRIREMAGQANGGPWFVERGGGIHMDGTWDYSSIKNGRAPAIAQVGYRGQSAEWIATMNPVVAEPLARELELHATWIDLVEKHGGRSSTGYVNAVKQAGNVLTIARWVMDGLS